MTTSPAPDGHEAPEPRLRRVSRRRDLPLGWRLFFAVPALVVGGALIPAALRLLGAGIEHFDGTATWGDAEAPGYLLLLLGVGVAFVVVGALVAVWVLLSRPPRVGALVTVAVVSFLLCIPAAAYLLAAAAAAVAGYRELGVDARLQAAVPALCLVWLAAGATFRAHRARPPRRGPM